LRQWVLVQRREKVLKLGLQKVKMKLEEGRLKMPEVVQRQQGQQVGVLVEREGWAALEG